MRKVLDLRAEQGLRGKIPQPLSWRQDMIQQIHVDNPTSLWQEPHGAVRQVLLQLVVAHREEGRQYRIVWEWIEGRGDER